MLLQDTVARFNESGSTDVVDIVQVSYTLLEPGQQAMFLDASTLLHGIPVNQFLGIWTGLCTERSEPLERERRIARALFQTLCDASLTSVTSDRHAPLTAHRSPDMASSKEKVLAAMAQCLALLCDNPTSVKNGCMLF